jgi:hypothetical protein
MLMLGSSSFGGGFELMKAGGDKEGIWTLMGSGMRYVIVHSTLYVSQSPP